MLEPERRDAVTIVRLRHGKASALDVELLDRLAASLAELEAAPAEALVMTGSGSIFSAGVDLRRLIEGGADYVRRLLPALNAALGRLYFFPKPVVMAVNGHAIAGDALLAWSGDLRLMARHVGRIGVPELLVGVPFPALPLEIVRATVPARWLQQLVFGGACYAPEEALELGLLDELHDPAELVDQAVERARQLAALPAAAFRCNKLQLRQPVRDFIDAHQDVSSLKPCFGQQRISRELGDTKSGDRPFLHARDEAGLAHDGRKLPDQTFLHQGALELEGCPNGDPGFQLRRPRTIDFLLAVGVDRELLGRRGHWLHLTTESQLDELIVPAKPTKEDAFF